MDLSFNLREHLSAEAYSHFLAASRELNLCHFTQCQEALA
jgi:hypothetical protein